MSKISLKSIRVNKNYIEYEYDKSEDLMDYIDDNIPFFVEYQTDINFKEVPNSILAIPFLLNSGVPGVVFKIFPYVATLILLAFTSKNSAAPKAAGEPFDKAKR